MEHGRSDVYDDSGSYDDGSMDEGQSSHIDDDIQENDSYDDFSDDNSEIHPDIDFDSVYALHTFRKTVEGQASVTKGDVLKLEDDSNSYWWLVRVLRSDEVGYIPAEGIETPYERLARYNKKLNIDIATATDVDRQINPTLTRRPPQNSRRHGEAIKPGKLAEKKSVNWTTDTYHPHTAPIYGSEDGSHEGYSSGAHEDDDEQSRDSIEEERKKSDEEEERVLRLQRQQEDAAAAASAAQKVQGTNQPSSSPQGKNGLRINTGPAATARFADDKANLSVFDDDGVGRGSQQPRSLSNGSQASRSESARSMSPDGSYDERGGKKLRKDEDLSDKKKKGVLGKLFGRSKKDKNSSPTKKGHDNDASSIDTAEDHGLDSPAQRGPSLSYAVQQNDQQQQAKYQQFMQRSPIGSAQTLGADPTAPGGSALSPAGRLQSELKSSKRGSLLVADAPMLSVLRIFAGEDVRSEATFKTILMNHTSTSSDIISQAMQRLQVHSNGGDTFYLSIKQIDGSETALTHDQRPLHIIESLGAGTAASNKDRSSIGSIQSLLGANGKTEVSYNDYGDDSNVKLYLNRRSTPNSATRSRAPQLDLHLSALSPLYPKDVSNFSPTTRFPMHISLFPADLSQEWTIDPVSSLVVSRGANSNSQRSPEANVCASKVFFFARNTTVAEAVEASLDRFGVQDGVVAGGDSVERRSSYNTKTEYRLVALVNGQEKPLQPNSKCLEAFAQPPNFRAPEHSGQDLKRRSLESALLIGNLDDLLSTDPKFVLRKSLTRSLSSRLREEQAMGQKKGSPLSQTSNIGDAPRTGGALSSDNMSRQEIITAQRAASRANQQNAILSASSNTYQGTDIYLSADRGLIRSSMIGEGGLRYSYVQPSGVTTDISDIVEQEVGGDQRQGDLLAGAPDERIASVLQRMNSNQGALNERAISPPYKNDRSAESSVSTYNSARAASNTPPTTYDAHNSPHTATGPPPPFIIPEDYGLSRMIAIIHAGIPVRSISSAMDDTSSVRKWWLNDPASKTAPPNLSPELSQAHEMLRKLEMDLDQALLDLQQVQW